MARSEKDEAFEHFLDQNATTLSESTIRTHVILVARHVFYGEHYDRLFSDIPPLPCTDCDPRTLRLRVNPEALEVGQDWCARFLTEHPQARDPYLF